MAWRHVVLAIACVASFISPGEACAQDGVDARQLAEYRDALLGLSDDRLAVILLLHHQQGIEITQLQERKGRIAHVRALASTIRRSFEREVRELNAHAGAASRRAAEADVPQRATVERLRTLTVDPLAASSGDGFDQAFIETMARHHQMSIDMIETAVLEDGELAQLAQRIREARRQELEELNRLGALRSTGGR